MGISKALVGVFWLLLGAVLFGLASAGVLPPRAVLAQPNAGQEPKGDPIVHNLTPKEGAIVTREDLSRASATIETQRQASLSWAGIFVDGQRRPGELMGPTPYQQSISTDIGDLGPGAHSVKVMAIDSQGRAGGWSWRFTVI